MCLLFKLYQHEIKTKNSSFYRSSYTLTSKLRTQKEIISQSNRKIVTIPNKYQQIKPRSINNSKLNRNARMVQCREIKINSSMTGKLYDSTKR